MYPGTFAYNCRRTNGGSDGSAKCLSNLLQTPVGGSSITIVDALFQKDGIEVLIAAFVLRLLSLLTITNLTCFCNSSPVVVKRCPYTGSFMMQIIPDAAQRRDSGIQNRESSER